MQKHLYYCDLCGKEIDRVEMQLIVPTIDNSTTTSLEVCPKCLREINNAIDAKIAELSNGEVIVERPYK